MVGELFLIDIGFLPVRIWDLLDIAIVGYLLFRLYKLLKGSIAFNIFIGVSTLYIIWWLVGVLQMDLLARILNQFASVGVIILIIVFQPEVRRFLLLLGNSTLRQRSKFFSTLIDKNLDQEGRREKDRKALQAAILRMGRLRIGALIVVAPENTAESLSQTGVSINAEISQPLVESIFNKESPLHDGAIVISGRILRAAGCILPVSDSQEIPKNLGLRHRAGVGISEVSESSVFIVSEENGSVSFASKGKLLSKLEEPQVEALLKEHL